MEFIGTMKGERLGRVLTRPIFQKNKKEREIWHEPDPTAFRAPSGADDSALLHVRRNCCCENEIAGGKIQKSSSGLFVDSRKRTLRQFTL